VAVSGVVEGELFAVSRLGEQLEPPDDVMTKHGRPPDDVSSAPESGTVRDDTSGNQPSDRLNRPGQTTRAEQGQEKDNPGTAGEEP
jgi:hypothetical protein